MLLDHSGHQRRSAADVHDHQREPRVEVLGQDGGDAAPEEDRVAGGRSLLRHTVPSGEGVTDGQRREGQRTNVATWSPTFRPRVDCGPTSATVPMSIPPDPVTGFCICPARR